MQSWTLNGSLPRSLLSLVRRRGSVAAVAIRRPGVWTVGAAVLRLNEIGDVVNLRSPTALYGRQRVFRRFAPVGVSRDIALFEVRA